MEQEALPQAACDPVRRGARHARLEPGSGIVRIFFPHRPGKGCGAGGIRKQICCGAPERCAVFFFPLRREAGAVSGVIFAVALARTCGAIPHAGCEWHVRFYAPVGILPGESYLCFCKVLSVLYRCSFHLLELIGNRVKFTDCCATVSTSKAFVIYLHCPQGCFGDGKEDRRCASQETCCNGVTTLSH